MKGNVEEAVAAGAHALFLPHGLGHMMGLDVHDMEDLGQIYVGYDDEIRPSSQFGLASLRMGRRLQEGFVITDEPGCYFIPALIDKWKAEKMHTDFLNFDAIEKFKRFWRHPPGRRYSDYFGRLPFHWRETHPYHYRRSRNYHE